MNLQRVCARCKNEVSNETVGYRADLFNGWIGKPENFYCCYKCYFADRSEKVKKRAPHYKAEDENK